MLVMSFVPDLSPLAWGYATPPPVNRQIEGGFAEYFLPAGTPFHVLLQSRLNTEVNQVGDPVESRLTQTVYLGEQVMLPAGTRLIGYVSRLDKPMAGQNAILGLRFSTILLPNGERIPIQAYVKTQRGDHMWGGGLTQGTVPKTVTHQVWGIGRYNQTIYTGPRQMGTHVGLMPGEHWIVVLEKPVTLMQPAQQLDQALWTDQ